MSNPPRMYPECYHGKFLPGDQQCHEPAVYASAGLDNLADGWTWCLSHAPSKDYRRLLARAVAPEEPTR
jgi:hypothetical protein